MTIMISMMKGNPLKRRASIAVSGIACMILFATFAAHVHASVSAGPISPQSVQDCDATAHATTLVPSSLRVDARAIWLNEKLIQWPGMRADARLQLVSSLNGTLAITVGKPLPDGVTIVPLSAATTPLPASLRERFKWLKDGAIVTHALNVAAMKALLTRQVVIVETDASNTVRAMTGLQTPGALDALYAPAASVALGANVGAKRVDFALWAPTARAVSICVYASGKSRATNLLTLSPNEVDGVWRSQQLPAAQTNLRGRYYTYLVDVFVPNVGLVRNRVTDPYSLSLTTDSARSYIVDMNDARVTPPGWNRAAGARKNRGTRMVDRVQSPVDMAIYELHVRDFSIGDITVPARDRGKYTAFTHKQSDGMKHLAALSRAGMTDVHLLPVFDLATVPEAGCVTPSIPANIASDSDVPAKMIAEVGDRDCFNWGYDPFHFNAPEGSYATDAADGARRIFEFRQMVMAQHDIGMRVGMDVVYNHTSASGQSAKSVLDRIVPGYYHRLNAEGKVEQSTCCENTATEHLMMAKLMIDSAVVWARDYRIDSFRFDLMGHQPRSVMEELQRAVNTASQRRIDLIGEGWNFGEISDGARFVQASQLSLNGSGIGTFSDRARDAIRGGTATEGGVAMVRHQGYASGIHYAQNAFQAGTDRREGLYRAADMVRVGLAGSIRPFTFKTWRDEVLPLSRIDYNGQPAGYVSTPGEVVNYVENHDNHTLFDVLALKLPTDVTREQRARAQVVALALNTFSQGVAYFHAGGELLRSKSMDKNSYDSGDWFNRIDWTMRDNYFATGMPRESANKSEFEWIRPLLNNPNIKPTPREIAWTNAAFLDLLRIRASTPLFRLRTADEIVQRLKFYNVSASQTPTVIVGHLDGRGLTAAQFADVVYLVNVNTKNERVNVPELKGRKLTLHPVQASARAAETRAREAKWDDATGEFVVPAQTAVVFVSQ